MEVLESKEALRDWCRAHSNRPRAFVPTMGALHRGHTSLIDLASAEVGTEGDVVVSIFVNPTQFGPGEDFEAYPRQLQDDLDLCREHQVAAVFAPRADEIYFNDASVALHESTLSLNLCGGSRPGHFDGVCLVVAKLFHLVEPTIAVFGEKDYQQLAVIRRMVRDLDFPIEIIGGETVREADGLALSSRNAYLSAEERGEAPVLYQAISAAAAQIEAGLGSPTSIESEIRTAVEATEHGRGDYVSIVDASTLAPITEFSARPVRVIGAAFFGQTRLIDNIGATPLNTARGQ